MTKSESLRWFGQLQRRDGGYVGQRILRIEQPGRRKRERLQRRFVDVVKEDTQRVGVTEHTGGRVNVMQMVRCGPKGSCRKKKKMMIIND